MPAMPSPGSRRWMRRGLVAAAVLLVLAGGAAAFVLLHSPGNVSHPNLEFTSPTTLRPKPAPKVAPAFEWPRYGYDAARTRYFASGHRLDPPFRVGWKFEDFALLEFPPVIYGRTLFLLDDDGSAKALDAATGHKLWETKVGTLAAASPALGIPQRLLFVPILSTHGHAPGKGRLVALSMNTGRVVWSHSVPAGTESAGQFNTFTRAVRMGITVVSSIALLAAGIGIMNIMLVSVTERTREIGIRRAIGAKKRNIMTQFILEAIVICEVGGAIGVLLGIAGGNATAFFLKMTPVIPFDWVVYGLLICSVVGIIFGTYPAFKAANLDPIESLRYE